MLKIKLKFRRYLNLLQQVRWFVTWVESSIISSGSNLTQNIIRETIKVEKNRDNIEFRRILEWMVHLEDDFYF